ncbi:ATP-dependent helicase [Candidatus Woesearchaeota archaeon]|nr:MAG: ATP-dependent helicase [Candidatus Woesearchaeota archaeon]
MENFRKLGIIEPILKIIKEQGFKEPTEIQKKAIPLVLAGDDVIGGSATGSGKTLVFGSGIIKKSEKGRGIQSVILTPTRELAQQIKRELRKFSKHKPLEITAVYGGVSINPQMDALRTADVVVGTPGRMLDHLERQTIDLSHVNTLVLDEADRMLDMGFIEDVEKIISQCPKNRQTLLFSATIPPEIAKLSENYMKDPIKVSAEVYVDPKKLKQIYYDVRPNLKFSLLVNLLKKERSGLVMVFCNTRRNTDFVANHLKQQGIETLAIHGGLTQKKRDDVMKHFHSKNVYVLVCTDVAARGLDIKGVSHIYNYDIPRDSKEYVHRIGRTARAGKQGRVINLLADRDYDNFTRVLRDNDVEITKEQTPYIEKVKLKELPKKRPFLKRSQRVRRGWSDIPKHLGAGHHQVRSGWSEKRKKQRPRHGQTRYKSKQKHSSY